MLPPPPQPVAATSKNIPRASEILLMSRTGQLLYSQNITQNANEDIPTILTLLGVKGCCLRVKVCNQENQVGKVSRFQSFKVSLCVCRQNPAALLDYGTDPDGDAV